jgi:predicted DNA-binding transcriptional regulator AlpA
MQTQVLRKDSDQKSRESLDKDRLLTPQQLANMLNLPIASIYDMRYRGTGPRAIKISGKALRFRLSDVEAWLRDRETQSSAEDP